MAYLPALGYGGGVGGWVWKEGFGGLNVPVSYFM